MEKELEELLNTLFKPDVRVYEDPDEEEHKVWITREGDEIPIKDMSDSHLINAIRFWRDWNNPSMLRYSINHPNDDSWEKVQKIRDQLKTPKEIMIFTKAMANIGHTRSMYLNRKYKYLWQEAKKRGLYK